MFTGIVEEIGEVVSRTEAGGRARLTVAAARLASEVRPGDSVAVAGACLTVVSAGGGRIEFDVVPETLRRTTLGGVRRGERVNLEGALRVGDRLSGHFVAGHVDGVGEVLSAREEGGQRTVRFRAPAELAPFLVEKGSVAVEGVSLTQFDVAGREFSVALVPHTLSITTLGSLARGARVNLEADLLARFVVKHLSSPPPGIDRERLRAAGYGDGAGEARMEP